MTPEPWHWLTLAVILAVGEILLPSLILIWPALAAFAVAIIAFLFAQGGNAQLATFLICLVVSVFLGIRWRPHLAKRSKHKLNQGATRLIGQQSTLQNPIVNGVGTIKLGDTIWPAHGPDMPAGTVVKVIETEGSILKVDRP